MKLVSITEYNKNTIIIRMQTKCPNNTLISQLCSGEVYYYLKVK